VIDENLDNEEFGVEQLAEAMHMSPSSLYRKIQALTNLATIQIIQQVRLDKAVMLLKKGLSIGEVAYQVGFHNPSSFTNFFKKYYGVSPREFLNI
jgi:AraC-like DNA-binding protein